MNLKQKLEAKKAKLIERRNKVEAQLIKEENAEARAALGETLTALRDDINEVEEMLKTVDEPAGEPAPAPAEGEEGRGLNVLGSMTTRSAQPAKKTDPYDTEEYRTAFMEFCKRGTPIPANLRGNAVTKTTDASAVIPTTILNEIVSELKVYGNIYSEVRELNVQGGVNIPILSLKPTATWIT
ncbi:MAG: phage major capsid protein, partial [Clostridia bacterium]|nr:phage major capsid protein [Clostridia bacterium]